MKWKLIVIVMAAGLVLLQAHATWATTTDLYVVNIDENGNGSYAEYSPPVVGDPIKLHRGVCRRRCYPTGDSVTLCPTRSMLLKDLTNG